MDESDAGVVHLRRVDALEIVEEDVTLTSQSGGAHLLVIEMAKTTG